MHANAPGANPAPTPLLTRGQAAAWLGISIRKLDALIASGRLPAVRIDTCVRLDPIDLAAFAAASKEGGQL